MIVEYDFYCQMVAGLKHAALTFRQYEELHRAKGTIDSDMKAAVNQIAAEQLEEIITKATALATDRRAVGAAKPE